MEEEKSRYPFFVETFEEEARIRDQSARLNQLFRPVDAVRHLVNIGTALDLACGTGTWAMDRAREYPGCFVNGIDISKRMIKYAQVQAQANGIENVSFQVGDVLKPLPFEDNHFHCVYARLINGFVPRDSWPALLAECWRVLKPGGYIRLIEPTRPECNKPASTKFSAMAAQMGVRIGVSFSPDGQQFGVCNMLPHLLLKAGFTIVAHDSRCIDYSWWSDDHPIWCDNVAAVLRQIPKALAAQKRPASEIAEAEHLVAQALAEMDEPDFCALIFFLSVVGRKPE